MEYKNCKQHTRDKHCRECACGAWCSNDNCTCGCHNTPTYSLSDFMTAKYAANEARECVDIIQAQQLAERHQIENRLLQLNAELNQFLVKRTEAFNKLDDMKRRVLGPWQDTKYDSNILIAGGTDKSWDNRVWLTIAGCEGNQWRVRIRNVEDHGNREWVLGPPIGPRKEDLARNKLKAEAYIIKMGYILNVG